SRDAERWGRGSMLLDEQFRPAPPGEATVEALAERVRATRLAVLGWTPAAVQLRQRIACASEHLDGEWPPLDDRTLLATLDEWLAPFLQQATNRDDLAALDLEMVLTTMWTWDQQTQLAALVPATITTAAGRSVAIDYARDMPNVAGAVEASRSLTAATCRPCRYACRTCSVRRRIRRLPTTYH